VHDPEKACPGLDPGWIPVFGKACPPARPEGSCTSKRRERDDDSKKVITLGTMRRAHRKVHRAVWPVLALAVLFGLGAALWLRPPPPQPAAAAPARP